MRAFAITDRALGPRRRDRLVCPAGSAVPPATLIPRTSHRKLSSPCARKSQRVAVSGSGYCPPHERPVEKVRNDVEEKWITKECAFEVRQRGRSRDRAKKSAVA